uniref:Uncharacterized protein n=1 Tax=Caenorhabditis tropicalis TaxID=1561998 RepID=A0A1I7V486_9PELO
MITVPLTAKKVGSIEFHIPKGGGSDDWLCGAVDNDDVCVSLASRLTFLTRNITPWTQTMNPMNPYNAQWNHQMDYYNYYNYYNYPVYNP